MFTGTQVKCVSCITPKALAGGVKTKSPILVAGILGLTLFFTSGAQAQCTAGVNITGVPAAVGGVVAQAAVMAVANVSASVGTLVTSTNSVNTAFLTQSNAFIGSPADPRPEQEGGGVWTRGVGGHLDAGTTTTTGNISFGGPAPGNITCKTHTLEDFAGVQIGTDFARLNVNGWNLHAGSTIGYLGSKTHDATYDVNPPASFRDNLQIPFVGVYGAASYGGFLVDGQVRGDFFQNEVSDDHHGISGQRFDARGIILTANVAYHRPLYNYWFIEPSAGIVWSRTHVDPLNVPGTGVFQTPAVPEFVPPWVLTVNDIESTLGRLSMLVGTTVTSGSLVLQPFASASVFHEFQGSITSSLTSNFSAIGVSLPTLNSTVSTTSLGTYGQFGLGITARVVDTAWVGYLRGDYRRGDDVEGWSVNGGLRYQFVPAPVVGAPAKAPFFYKASPTDAGYNWNGFYIGAYLGAGWGHANWTFRDDGATIDSRFAGVLGGGEIGYNYQIGKWVFGLEADAGAIHARGVQPCPTGFFYNCEFNFNWLSTATARIGYAYWDRLLVYAKAGAVIAQDQAKSVCDTNSQPTISTVVLNGCPSEGDSKIQAGWTVGWGYEFGLTQDVSVKSEMMYFDLGNDRYNIVSIPIDIRRNGFISTVGLHFRFGG
jgi:opacity protein-like surface antigen